jgi:hypothetical protein
MPSLVEYGYKSISSGSEVNWSLGATPLQITQFFLYCNGWAESNEYRGFLWVSYQTTFSYGLRSFGQDVGGVWHQATAFFPAQFVYGNRVYFKAAKNVPSGAQIHLTALL